MAPGARQHKLGRRRGLRHHGDYSGKSESNNVNLGIGHSHGKRLVEVHVANITTTSGRVRETNLCIQVRSVEVDLTTVLMDDIARLLDAILKHTVGRWVRDLGDDVRPGSRALCFAEMIPLTMNAARLSLCCSAFARRSAMSRLPSGKALHRDHLQAGHDCGLEVFQRQKVTMERHTHRRIRSMRAGRNETDIPMTLTTRLVVSPDYV
jgi:hypothetical protein